MHKQEGNYQMAFQQQNKVTSIGWMDEFNFIINASCLYQELKNKVKFNIIYLGLGWVLTNIS